MVAQQKTVKDHKLVILLKKHSEIVRFIIELRLKCRDFNIDWSPTLKVFLIWLTTGSDPWSKGHGFFWLVSPSFHWKISNYFLSIQMILMESTDMLSLSEQSYIHWIIIWTKSILSRWCLTSIAKNMVKWMKCFVLSEAVLLKNHRVYFSDICIKESGMNGELVTK